MGLFSFDPNTETPQMLALRRQQIANISGQIGGKSTVGGGWGDVLRGLGAGFANYRVNQNEHAGNAYGTSAVDNLASLLTSPPQVPGLPQPPSNNAVGAGIKQALSTGQPPQLAVYTPPNAQQPPSVQAQPAPVLPSGAMPSIFSPKSPTNYDPSQALPTAPPAPVPIPQANAAPAAPAPMVAPTADTQPAPMAPASNEAALIPKIMQILNNPWVSDQDKIVLRDRLSQIQKQSDPMYQAQLGKAQLDLKNAQEPSSPTVMTDKSGNILSYDPNDPAGTMKVIRKASPADMAGGVPSKVKEYQFYSQQEKDAGRTPLSYEQFTARAQGTQGVSSDDISAVGDAIISGNQPPDTKGLYRGGLPVKAYLQKHGFNLSEANQEWQAASKFISSSQGPQQLRVRQNIDALAQSLPHLQDLVDKYKAGRFPMLNSAMMAADYNGFTTPEQQSLVNLIKQQISDVQAQTAGVIMGSGSPTDAAFQLAHDQLQANWSQKSIDDALANMKLNLQYRVNALKNAVPDNNRYVQAPAIAPDAPLPGAPPAAAAPSGEQWTIDANGNPVKVK